MAKKIEFVLQLGLTGCYTLKQLQSPVTVSNIYIDLDEDRRQTDGWTDGMKVSLMVRQTDEWTGGETGGQTSYHYLIIIRSLS